MSSPLSPPLMTFRYSSDSEIEDEVQGSDDDEYASYMDVLDNLEFVCKPVVKLKTFVGYGACTTYCEFEADVASTAVANTCTHAGLDLTYIRSLVLASVTTANLSI